MRWKVMGLFYLFGIFVHLRDIALYLSCNCHMLIMKTVDDQLSGTTTNISIRMDAGLKSQAEALFDELGMNLSTAFNIFVRQSLREGQDYL